MYQAYCNLQFFKYSFYIVLLDRSLNHMEFTVGCGLTHELNFVFF